MNQEQYLNLGLILTAFGLILSLNGQASLAQESNFEEISSLATGGKFYLDMDTFQPVGGGKLRYSVIGDGQGSGDRVSVNEINCATGQFKSPIESWAKDRQGEVSSRIPGPQGPMTVSKRTRLHGLLKNACAQYAPNAQGDW